MGFDPALAVQAPQSAELRLVTRPLRDLVAGGRAEGEFDDSCLLTHVEGAFDALRNVRVRLHQGRKSVRGLHLALLSTAGQIDLAVGDDDTRVFIGSGCNCRLNLLLFRRPQIFVGDGTTMQQVRLIGAHADVIIGRDGLWSDEILLQSHDQHPLVDVATGDIINLERRHVHIDEHVWVGRRVTLMPDIHLHAGCVIGTGAVVTRDVEAECVAAGVPARVVRRGVTWLRQPGLLAEWRAERGL